LFAHVVILYLSHVRSHFRNVKTVIFTQLWRNLLQWYIDAVNYIHLYETDVWRM
jgi:hypothetical protein